MRPTPPDTLRVRSLFQRRSLRARVVNLAVTSELFADFGVLGAFVGHQVGLALNVGAEDRGQIVFLDALNVERASPSASLNEGQDRILVGVSAADGLAFLAADKGLIAQLSRSRTRSATSALRRHRPSAAQ